MPPTKTQRWLDLIALLLGRRIPLTVEEIMERVPAYAEKWERGGPTDQATARRTFERDKDALREAGIPLELVRFGMNYGAETVEGYRIAHGDFYLPYLHLVAPEVAPSTGSAGPVRGGRSPGRSADAAGGRGAAAPVPAAHRSSPASGPAARRYPGLPDLDLSTSEAEVALEALRRVAGLPAFPFAEEARSALRKLSFDIDPSDFPGDPVVWVERPGSRELLDRLRTLSDALLARKRVSFAYHGIYRGQPTDREVEPYGLFFQRDWYLVARDTAADAPRIFRVSRMQAIRPNSRAPKSPDYTLPADFSLQDHLDRSAWELGQDDEMLRAEVRFDYPLSLQAERNGDGELLREEPDGGAVRAFRVSRPNPFLRWILSLGGAARILEPAELRDAFDEMAGAVAALYAEELAHHG